MVTKRVPIQVYQPIVRFNLGPPREVGNRDLLEKRLSKFGITSEEVTDLATLFARGDLGILEEKVGVDTTTGYDVWWSPEERTYISEFKGKEERRSIVLRLSYTASIETRGGSEIFTAEITASIVVSNKNSNELDTLIEEIDKKVQSWVFESFDSSKTRGENLSDKIIKKGREIEVTMGEPTNTLHIILERTEPRDYKLEGDVVL